MFELSANTEMTMSSREIAELTQKQHGHVKRDIEKMRDELNLPNLDSSIFTHNGNEYTQYHLNRDLTLTLVSGYSTKLRYSIVKRWDELESQAKPQVPQTFADALLLAANQAKELEEKNKALELAAPKAEFVDRYVESTGLMTFRQVAKQLEIKEPTFRSFLVAIGAMYQLSGSWSAYQKHIDAGRFKVRQGEKNGHAYVTTKFTPKGVEWVARRWNEFRQAAA
ncbi:phage antirepressor KilAC domain-containing protein [Vibrio gangliei]|uniref:phage antirepressor KilAC domain-containing protein n=1 Tax=Vibrio gangliei TaxID=2077090 RepID=UPI000D020960|nr:phage antirepressor KilAC domain-containing protein [Vibrio gangliei]